LRCQGDAVGERREDGGPVEHGARRRDAGAGEQRRLLLVERNDLLAQWVPPWSMRHAVERLRRLPWIAPDEQVGAAREGAAAQEAHRPGGAQRLAVVGGRVAEEATVEGGIPRVEATRERLHSDQLVADRRVAPRVDDLEVPPQHVVIGGCTEAAGREVASV